MKDIRCGYCIKARKCRAYGVRVNRWQRPHTLCGPLTYEYVERVHGLRGRDSGDA